MQTRSAHRSVPEVRLRAGDPSDLDALVSLEERVFAGDRVSRRGFRRFLNSPRAALIVAVEDGVVAGYALVLFRAGSVVARLYSLAVAPEFARRGIGTALLKATEEAAIARERFILRLEVHEKNDKAIARYRKAGYALFGRHFDYYTDRADALRFEKRLTPQLRSLKHPPPYFHQTTEFTCGPACVMMALAWANPRLRPSPALEFKLWRESTTIFLSSGHGGCDPYGLAVTLRRHGVVPEIHVSGPGPYFLDTVGSDDKRRVMRLTQQEFRREATELGIPAHLTTISESALIAAFNAGATAIVLLCGYHMLRRGVPHWVFAFGHEGRYVLVHDPAARGNDRSTGTAAETYAIPWTAFMKMTRFGRDDLSATILIRKGSHQ
jgi:ribosomal protein S18 acetylase RimI-like enzyme